MAAPTYVFGWVLFEASRQTPSSCQSRNCDRVKDVVISGGENISTGEIEQALLTHRAVLEAAVIGVPDEKCGERPKAFVVLKPGEKEIIDHVKSTIARNKAPKAVAFVDELQRPQRTRSRSSSSGSASGPGETPESRTEDNSGLIGAGGLELLETLMSLRGLALRGSRTGVTGERAAAGA